MNDINSLIELRKNKKFIGMDSFNVEVIEQLKNNDVFSVNEYKGKTYDNYKTILSLATQENELTTPQKKLFTAIVMNDVFKYLDKCIGNEKQVETPIKEVEKADIKIEDLPF